jgi:ribosome-associated translation inhibitor RaiA
MRTEVRVHGIDLSDELRAIVHHETERLVQALRRPINSVRVDLYDEQRADSVMHCTRCQIDVLFDDGSCLVQMDQEEDCYHCVSEAFLKILCTPLQVKSRLDH